MEVNLTLFVQMGNFAIAYCLLRFLLFKPVLAVLDERDLRMCDAKNRLQEHERALFKQRKEVEDSWVACRDHFKEHTPSIDTQDLVFRDISPIFSPSQVTDQLVINKQQEIERVIIKKVSHVNS